MRDPVDMEGLLRFFTFTKKSELIKYARSTQIHMSDFALLVMACHQSEPGELHHQMSFHDEAHADLKLTPADHRALRENGLGRLSDGAQSAVSKIWQTFKQRRYVFGHMFTYRETGDWHFFGSGNRHLQEHGNHYKGGPHLHMVSWLWGGAYTRDQVWSDFNAGSEVSGAEHVRFVTRVA